MKLSVSSSTRDANIYSESGYLAIISGTIKLTENKFFIHPPKTNTNWN